MRVFLAQINSTIGALSANAELIRRAHVDVDFLLFWIAKQQLTCTLTDQNGCFELDFKFCCEWQPWWRHLVEQELNRVLAKSIIDALSPEKRIGPLRLPGAEAGSRPHRLAHPRDGTERIARNHAILRRQRAVRLRTH